MSLTIAIILVGATPVDVVRAIAMYGRERVMIVDDVHWDEGQSARLFDELHEQVKAFRLLAVDPIRSAKHFDDLRAALEEVEPAKAEPEYILLDFPVARRLAWIPVRVSRPIAAAAGAVMLRLFRRIPDT